MKPKTEHITRLEAGISFNNALYIKMCESGCDINKPVCRRQKL